MEMETSVPMEISVQNLTNGDIPHHLPDVVPELAVTCSPAPPPSLSPSPSPAPTVAEDKFHVSGNMNSK